MRKFVAASLCMVTLSGCMGSFVLTKTLYDFNSRLTDNKIINNIVFWAFIILPVYNLAILGDAVILNLIEFWTGKNLLASDIERRDDGSMRVVKDGDEIIAEPIDATHVRVKKNGVVIGTLEIGPKGELVVNDANGVPMDVLLPEEQQAMAPAVESLAAR